MAPEDAKLRGRIHQALTAHGHLDATKVGVVVRDGEVLLWGSVATANERSLAGEITAAVVDRTAIINHIQVFPGSQG